MGHDHQHGTGVRHRGRLALVLGLTFTVFAVEAVVAWLSGSLALLADAGHMLGDSFGIVMALVAISVGGRKGPLGSRRTFGYQRAEVIAAGLNGLVLVGLAIWIVVQAVGRLGDAPTVEGGLVLVTGAVGLVVNVVGMLLLRDGSQESLNVRGAYLEVMGDALGSLAVMASALVIVLTGWYPADAIASLLIAALIMPRAVSLLRDVAEVLLEATPRDVDLDELREHIVAMEGVSAVHDLHVWTITSGMPVMSAHVVVDPSVQDMAGAEQVLDRLRGCLSDHFDVEHSTFQIEPGGHIGKEQHLHH